MAEGEARLTPCETETPKSTKNSCFKAGSDYTSHPKLTVGDRFVFTLRFELFHFLKSSLILSLNIGKHFFKLFYAFHFTPHTLCDRAIITGRVIIDIKLTVATSFEAAPVSRSYFAANIIVLFALGVAEVMQRDVRSAP